MARENGGARAGALAGAALAALVVEAAPAQVMDHAPTWSPDGAWILFTSDRGGAVEPYVARPDGSDVRRLAVQGRASQVAFSPDGVALVFEERDDDLTPVRHSRVVVTRADGTGRSVVAEGATDPHWSPDGRRLLFKTWSEAEGGWRITVAPVAGGDLQVLGPGVHPSWSPDGTRITFMVEDGASARIWVMAADGRGGRCVSCPPGDGP